MLLFIVFSNVYVTLHWWFSQTSFFVLRQLTASQEVKMTNPCVKWWNWLHRGSTMPSAQYTADFCRYLAHIQKAFKVQIYLDCFFKVNKTFHQQVNALYEWETKFK